MDNKNHCTGCDGVFIDCQDREQKCPGVSPSEAARQADLEHDPMKHEQLMNLQHRRMRKATKLWQDEDPKNRKHTLPDLGRLLDWLMRRGTPLGHINRIQACPRCGPKFEKGYRAFKKEVKELLRKEKGIKIP